MLGYVMLESLLIVGAVAKFQGCGFKFGEVLGNGKFGIITKALYNDMPVAVKTPITQGSRQSIYDEVSIYKSARSDFKDATLFDKHFVRFLGVLYYSETDGCMYTPIAEFTSTYSPRSSLDSSLPVSSPAPATFYGIVMELCTLMKTNLLSTLSGLAQVSLGLGHLHAHNYLYRDVKLDNMVNCHSVDGENVKLGDFGSVHSLFDLPATSSLHVYTKGYTISNGLVPQDIIHHPGDVDTYALAMTFVKLVSSSLFYSIYFRKSGIALADHRVLLKDSDYVFTSFKHVVRSELNVLIDNEPSFAMFSPLIKQSIDYSTFPNGSGRFLTPEGLSSVFSDIASSLDTASSHPIVSPTPLRTMASIGKGMRSIFSRSTSDLPRFRLEAVSYSEVPINVIGSTGKFKAVGQHVVWTSMSGRHTMSISDIPCSNYKKCFRTVNNALLRNLGHNQGVSDDLNAFYSFIANNYHALSFSEAGLSSFKGKLDELLSILLSYSKGVETNTNPRVSSIFTDLGQLFRELIKNVALRKDTALEMAIYGFKDMLFEGKKFLDKFQRNRNVLERYRNCNCITIEHIDGTFSVFSTTSHPENFLIALP